MNKLGIIGIGDIGKFHLQFLLEMKDTVSLTGISENNAEMKELRKKEHNLNEDLFFSDWKKLCESKEIDSVLIATPDFLHCEMACYALNCGKNVLCEKPMALNAQDAELMIETSKKNNKILMIGHVKRFWQDYRVMKDIIESGKYGKVEAVKFDCINRKFDNGWHSDMDKTGGILMSLGIHDIDTALWFFGEPKNTKNAGSVNKGFFDVAFSIWEYDDFVISFECSRLVGAKFYTELRIALNEATLIHKTGKDGGLKVLTNNGDETPKLEWKNSLKSEVEYFVDCVTRNIQPKDCMPQDSLTTVKIAKEITNSILTKD